MKKLAAGWTFFEKQKQNKKKKPGKFGEMCNNIVRMICILHTDMTRQLTDPTIQLQARGVHYPLSS